MSDGVEAIGEFVDVDPPHRIALSRPGRFPLVASRENILGDRWVPVQIGNDGLQRDFFVGRISAALAVESG
jgi:hypothetical protein